MRVNLERIAFGMVLALTAYVSSLRSLVFSSLHPSAQRFADQIWIELAYWLVAALLVAWLLVREGDLGIYFRNLRQQPSLLVFLAICCSSVLWSGDPWASAFRSSVLVLSTAIAAYVGMRCKPEEFLGYLSWFGAALVLASVYMALADPLLGMDRAYGPGVWRGIFWNKNHLGSIAALFGGLQFLALFGMAFGNHPGTRALLALAYLGSLFVVYKSHSAAGYLVALVIHGVVLLCLLWTVYGRHLHRRHYPLLIAAGAAFAAGVLGNMETIFRAFNKDITMTGRTSLWAYLLDEFVSKKLMLGHGFGSLWGDPKFRVQAFERLGFFPVIADNGFLDILLGVGVLGMSVFLFAYAKAWRGAVGFLANGKTIIGCWPVLVMSFSLIANISFSLLTEIEVLIWGLIVIVLFATSERCTRNMRNQ